MHRLKLKAIISALGSWPIRLGLIATIVMAIVVAAFLAVLATAPVSAASEEKPPLDCLSCHARVLKSHDKLGEGSKACGVCHDSNTMGMFRLFDGTQLPMTDSPLVCGQCHSKVYQSWEEETHGIVSVMLGEPRVPSDTKKSCVTCHNPHQPKIELSRIMESYPRSVPKEGDPLDCLSCHARVLESHDKLGEGSEACKACHSSTRMGVLHLANEETRFSLSDYPRLCAQCHQKRYEEWTQETHGMPSWLEGTVEVHGIAIKQVGCISCHDPHQPQMVFTNITKPHPLPAPSPPPPPVTLLLILGISLLLLIALGVVVAKKGKGS